MKTKAEMITFLQGKYLTVGTPAEVDEVDNVKFYNVIVTETANDGEAGIRKTLQFYVYDEGGGSEQAFLYDTKVDSWIEKAINWLYTNGHADVLNVLWYDDQRKKVLVKLYKATSATAAEEKLAICYQNGGVQVRVVRVITA